MEFTGEQATHRSEPPKKGVSKLPEKPLHIISLIGVLPRQPRMGCTRIGNQ